jgi:uncharacterized protein
MNSTVHNNSQHNTYRTSTTYTLLLALVTGVIFAAGLTLGGMTDPAKVQGFLNVGGIASGQWDPSLAFVMTGALIVSFIAFWSSKRRKTPWLAATFEVPTRKDIDWRLILGAVIFGAGWGIGGYCPGPALASVLSGEKEIAYFILPMIAGMLIAKKLFK